MEHAMDPLMVLVDSHKIMYEPQSDSSGVKERRDEYQSISYLLCQDKYVFPLDMWIML